MYVSYQGLQEMHQERVNTLLARSEHRRMVREARESEVRHAIRNPIWKALLLRARDVPMRIHRKSVYEPSSSGE
jgi:hypothetical protein